MIKKIGIVLMLIGVVLMVYATTPEYTIRKNSGKEFKAASIVKAQLEKEEVSPVPDGVEPVVLPVLSVPGVSSVYKVTYTWNETHVALIGGERIVREELLRSMGREDLIEPEEMVEPVEPQVTIELHELTIFVDVDAEKILYASKSAPMVSEELEPEPGTPYRSYGVPLFVVGCLLVLHDKIVSTAKKLTGKK